MTHQDVVEHRSRDVPRLSRLRAVPIACALLAHAAAPRAEPLFAPDSGPLTGLFGWQTTLEGGDIAPAGISAWRAHLTVASHSVIETNGDESLVLDGETRRIWLDWRRGLSDRLEVGLIVPWTWHESGSLDSLIDGWHDFFGLPEGNRTARPRDRLLFEYAAAGSGYARLDRNVSGPGDLRLHAGWLLRDDPAGHTALRIGLKLPTGDSDEFLGSGSTDVSVGVAGDRSGLWNHAGLSGFYHAALIYLGTPDFLAARGRHLAGQLGAGLAYDLTPAIALAAQTTVRSAPYDVAVEPLGDWAMSLSVGAGFRLPGPWRLTIGFSEDVKVESVPDVTFFLSLSGAAR